MRNKLISSLAGVAFSFAASGLALAADIATKAPAPSPPPVYNWTGWYVGVNAGASFGNVKTDFNAPVTVTSMINGVTRTFTTDFAGSDTADPSGFMGGGQVGYNWQYSPLIVAGLEADFQGALERDSSSALTSNFSGRVGGDLTNGSTVLDYATKIKYFGTVRGRIGYVWGNGNVMSYLTGLAAYGKVNLEGTTAVSGIVGTNVVAPFSFTEAIGHSQVNTGWVAGYGTEGVIDGWGAHNWTWKIEGLYMDLGHLDTTGSGASSGIVGTETPSA